MPNRPRPGAADAASNPSHWLPRQCLIPLPLPEVGAFINGFDRIKSVVYSFAGGNDVRGVVKEAVREHRPVTQVDIAWSLRAVDLDWMRADFPALTALSLNGRPVIIDISLPQLLGGMTASVVRYLAARVQTLSIIEEMWDIFTRVELPALRELAIYVRAQETWPDGDAPLENVDDMSLKRQLDTLRFVRAMDADVDLPVPVVANFVRGTVENGFLPSLFFCGVNINGDMGDLAHLVAQVARVPGPVRSGGNWNWRRAGEPTRA
ncbi:hypothetical protein AURDEDRAFT_173681 [Auricularia subglabra TFB-10046 SS5]|nr:hypothetical protein AURDEDRAFT_173681 [Auricularia subglabra TFB-10046 SS5]